MYALFYEHPDGHREWISGADTDYYALMLGRWWSRNGVLPVIGVRNHDSGETEICYRFVGGQRVDLDARDVPPTSGKPLEQKGDGPSGKSKSPNK